MVNFVLYIKSLKASVCMSMYCITGISLICICIYCKHFFSLHEHEEGSFFLSHIHVQYSEISEHVRKLWSEYRVSNKIRDQKRLRALLKGSLTVLWFELMTFWSASQSLNLWDATAGVMFMTCKSWVGMCICFSQLHTAQAFLHTKRGCQ